MTDQAAKRGSYSAVSLSGENEDAITLLVCSSHILVYTWL